MNSGGGESEEGPKTDPVLREIRSIGSMVRETKDKVESIALNTHKSKDYFDKIQYQFKQIALDFAAISSAISASYKDLGASLSARRRRRKQKDSPGNG